MARNHPATFATMRIKQKKRATKPNAPTHAKIVFTGNRRNDRYLILFDGKSIELPFSIFNAMIDLAVARCKPGNGYVRISPVVIFRLRRELDALSAGAGMTLIETGALAEYRFTIPVSELSAVLALSPCFLELVDLNLVSAERVAVLRTVCRWSSSEILNKSKPNPK